MSTTKVITGKVRFSYVNIFKSRAFQAGQDAKYSVCLLIPKEDKATIKKIKVYSGCWGRASINFFPFNTNGNKGVGVGLNNIQKLKDDDRLGAARASAESDFGGDDFEDDEDF